MGGAREIMLKSKEEKAKALAYLKPLDGFLALNFPFEDFQVDTGIYIGVNVGGCRTGLSIEYHLHSMASTLADFVTREITRRFTIKRIGSDSTGWYPNSNWKETGPRSCQETYGPYTDWVSWQRDYKPEWSFDARVLPEELPVLQKMDELVSQRFKELDALATNPCPGKRSVADPQAPEAALPLPEPSAPTQPASV